MYSKESVQKLVKQSESLKNLSSAVSDFYMYLLDYSVIDEDSVVVNMELEKLLQANREAQSALKGNSNETN